MRALNTFENAEFRLDRGSNGNLNFTVISSYKGSLNERLVKLGLRHLQKTHPLLRASPNATEKVSHFIETSAAVPFNVYPYHGSEQWKEIAKKDLSQRFTKVNEPLWRVSLLKGDHEGQILITFHHAIADGVCAMEMMNHFYRILAQLSNRQAPKELRFDTPIPDLRFLHPLSDKTIPKDFPTPSRVDKGYHTTFIKDLIDEPTTKRILKWTKTHGIKVNSTLFAALLLAVRRVLNPNYKELTAMVAVNYRPFFTPPFSKETLALLRTCLSSTFTVPEEMDLSILAKDVHRNLYSQLESGDHVLNLKTLEKKIARDISPQELWQRSKFPENAVTMTNLGSLEFSGKYKDSDLSMNELFFVANVEPFIEAPTNVVLGTVTFQRKISLTLWFLEELLPGNRAQEVLLEMKKILSKLHVV